jgi:hypothetical protein
MDEASSRVEEARRRVRTSRYVIGVAAAAAFAGLGLLVRAAHPGASSGATAGTASIPPSAFQNAQQSGNSFFGGGGGGTIAPSQSAGPTVQSGGS